MNTIEEFYNEEKDLIDHKLLTLHNPHARRPCDHFCFGDGPVFRLKNNYLRWTDDET